MFYGQLPGTSSGVKQMVEQANEVEMARRAEHERLVHEANALRRHRVRAAARRLFRRS
jgi:hypothetical protein